MKKSILSLNAPKPISPYSQAVFAGNFLFVSGQLTIDLKENKIVTKDISSQLVKSRKISKRFWKPLN